MTAATVQQIMGENAADWTNAGQRVSVFVAGAKFVLTECHVDIADGGTGLLVGLNDQGNDVYISLAAIVAVQQEQVADDYQPLGFAG